MDEAKEYIQKQIASDSGEMKIFYKFLDAQYSGWVVSAEGGKEDISILENVPAKIWHTVLGKIVERLQSPLKEYKYDIDEDEKTSTLDTIEDGEDVGVYKCKNVEAIKMGPPLEGLFHFPQIFVTE